VSYCTCLDEDDEFVMSHEFLLSFLVSRFGYPVLSYLGNTRSASEVVLVVRGSTAAISAQGSYFAMVVVTVLSHRYSWAQLGNYFLGLDWA
jgi:hypothetical protein